MRLPDGLAGIGRHRAAAGRVDLRTAYGRPIAAFGCGEQICRNDRDRSAADPTTGEASHVTRWLKLGLLAVVALVLVSQVLLVLDQGVRTFNVIFMGILVVFGVVVAALPVRRRRPPTDRPPEDS